MAKTKTKINTNIIYEAQGDKRFFFRDGQVVSRLNDLPQVLRGLDEDVYTYHVNTIKNDISAWVNDVFQQDKLSTRIAKARDKNKMAEVIERELK